MNKISLYAITAIFTCSCCATAHSAEKPAALPQAKAPAPAITKPMPPKPAAIKTRPKSNITMLFGSVTKIDSTDPNNVSIEVKDTRTDQTHIINTTPITNVTKVTRISELKTGDNVRVMARKTQDKEVALAIMFGNIDVMPRPGMPFREQTDTSKKFVPPENKTEKKK